jgi:hypothetical protein
MKPLAFTWGQKPEPCTKNLRDAGITTIVFLDFTASFKLVAEDKVAIEVGRSVKKENSY